MGVGGRGLRVGGSTGKGLRVRGCGYGRGFGLVGPELDVCLGPQLEGSVFGVLVLQLKPQLERVLNLPPNSLTKEIELTQQLLGLFVTYQIPADLLSFDGDATANGTAIGVVREHARAVLSMLDKAKKEEVTSSRQQFEYTHPAEAVHVDADAVADEVPHARAAWAPMPKMMRRSRQGTRQQASYRSDRSPSPAMAKLLRTSRESREQVEEEEEEEAAPIFRAAPVELMDAQMNAEVEGGARRAPTMASGEQPRNDARARPTPLGQGGVAGKGSVAVDFTSVPLQLEAAYNALDEDAAIHPTKIQVGDTWRRRSQAALLAAPMERDVHPPEQEREKRKAFDLIDALSRSGALTFEAASLHVVVAATHRFDESLMATVIQDNVNPIERLERSSLIVAAIIHGEPASALLQPDQLERTATFSAPGLLRPPVAAAVGSKQAQTV